MGRHAFGLVRRRRPAGPRPCMGAEVFREVLFDPRSVSLRVRTRTSAGSAGPLRPVEWLGLHAGAFLIGSCNFALVDGARGGGLGWSLLVIVIWAIVLAGHASVIAVANWLARFRRFTSAETVPPESEQ